MQALVYVDEIANADLMKPILSFAIPSRILLFKIMRACIAVENVEDLWIYLDKYWYCLKKLLSEIQIEMSVLITWIDVSDNHFTLISKNKIKMKNNPLID